MKNYNKSIRKVTLIFFAIFVFAGLLRAQLQWPVEQTNNDHPIGNSFGEYQRYGGGAYLHTGIDIREDCAPNGPWIRSVTQGTITLSDNALDATYRYNGVTIVTNNTTYRYWHLDHNSITNDVRNAVNNNTAFPTNTRISQIVDWTAGLGNFHHLHFDISRGGNFHNPFTEGMTPNNDNISPVIDDEIFICRNNSANFLLKPATGCWVVDGDLDIIAQASDVDPPAPAVNWQGNIGVYRIEYWIKELTGTASHHVPITELYRFDLFSTVGNGSNEASIIFKNDAPADSESTYWVQNGENYYHIVTNVDSAGNISEQNGFWDTDGGSFPDGLYQISIRAFDFLGNSHTVSDVVYVRNNPSSPSPVEIIIRDRTGDKGTIPSNPNGEPFWISPDIRVDAPPFGQVNATGQPFGIHDHDNPVYNQQNRVYVRVHNIGCAASGQVTIHLYWADPSGGIPASAWNEIAPSITKTVNNIPAGGSVEYSPPILWTPTGTAIGHRCMLVRLVSTQDPIINDYSVPWENNIGMKNITVINPSPGLSFTSQFWIKNIYRRPVLITLILNRNNFPKHAKVILEIPYKTDWYKELRRTRGLDIKFREKQLQIGFEMKKPRPIKFYQLPGERILARIKFVLPANIVFKRPYSVDIIQKVKNKITGGLTFVIPEVPRTKVKKISLDN